MNKIALILSGLADIAKADVGRVFESPRGSNRGATLAKYFTADDYKPGSKDEGYPWCASAVCFWIQTFLKDPAAKVFFSKVKPPRTARAFELIEWGKREGCLVFTPGECVEANAVGDNDRLWPQRGDIVVFSFSHCGIVEAVATRSKDLRVTEGNTDSAGSREGWQVAEKIRSFKNNPTSGRNEVRAFIRLTPRASKAQLLS